MHRLVLFFFALCCWKEALAETVPGGPAPVVLTEGSVPWEKISCSVHLPSSRKSLCPEVQLMSISHQILSLLSISCLDTRGSAEHSTEAFRPQGGSACWLF